jgi:predicted RND superfamily exporter protein
MALRFDWKFAVPMIVALLHDLVIALGVYALSGREVTSATVAALLTILGYSLYDTIIVFDRVRENEKTLRRQTYDQIVNISLWETATRSLNTSFATLLPILALFFFGGATLQDFAFALIVGIAIGAYSSFFVASPLLSVLKSGEPEYRGRKGSTELPAFMLGKAGAEQQAVAVAQAGVVTSSSTLTTLTARLATLTEELRRFNGMSAAEQLAFATAKYDEHIGQLVVTPHTTDGQAPTGPRP